MNATRSTSVTNAAIYEKLTVEQRDEAMRFSLSGDLLANYKMYLQCVDECPNKTAAWELCKTRLATQRVRLIRRVISIGRELDRAAAESTAETSGLRTPEAAPTELTPAEQAALTRFLSTSVGKKILAGSVLETVESRTSIARGLLALTTKCQPSSP